LSLPSVQEGPPRAGGVRWTSDGTPPTWHSRAAAAKAVRSEPPRIHPPYQEIMRWSPALLYVAVLVFLGSAVAILLSLERQSQLLALVGAFGNLLAGVLFVLSIWLPRRKVDWNRIETEQRLWESGPLGRSWLRLRRRLYNNRWKL